jgi:hypothetical protein
LPARSFLVLGVVGQSSFRRSAAPTEKDVIPGGAARDACADHKAANRGAVAAASGPRGPARGARLDSTRRNRNAVGCKDSRRQKERSSPAGRMDATARRRFFRASAYPRPQQTSRLSDRRTPPRRVAVGARRGAVGDSGGLVAGGAAGRCRWRGTSAAPASDASGGQPADRRASSSGTAAVSAGTTGRSL